MAKRGPYCYCPTIAARTVTAQTATARAVAARTVSERNLQNFKLRLRNHNSAVNGLQRIIANCAGSRKSNVNDGSPALQFVVPVAMKKIRCANGNTGGRGFDGGKPRVIIDCIVGQKYFLAAAPAHVER
jgi:hypothetical protein